MRHSIYTRLALTLVKAELKREEREWRRKVRRSAYDLPWHSEHLLRDIGLETDGRAIGIAAESPALKAERRIRHFNRLLRSRIAT
ncbi:DUF1127 domain-containing protein [Vibrio sp. SCSIO 43136]|uniref:DUF1127 domain-containing protein n=1 Tax=Vibrio sp. SCSIO 43136 TaxID=2819101 RepID=UPI002075DB0C|nr:DUF1127 domain-containing protein [Vibrio sp. SCSIO 43136]USD64885.1 DUF1127 domain-containing protein [Vibrio sp. SCSIO 43136]